MTAAAEPEPEPAREPPLRVVPPSPLVGALAPPPRARRAGGAPVRHLVALLLGWRVLRATGSVAAATARNAWRHRVLGLSAEAGFWQLLSLPSAVLGLLGTIGYLSEFIGQATVDKIEAKLLEASAGVLTPDTVTTVVRPTLNAVLNEGRASVISIGFLLSLWSGSSAMATFVNTISIAYDQRDMRGAVRARLLALGLYVASMAAGVVLLPTLVAGPVLLGRIPAIAHTAWLSSLVTISYWPVVGGLSLIALISLYHLAPPVRQRWRWAAPGALAAVGLWFVGSYGLRAYVSSVFGHTLKTGALGAPVAVLLFFYVTALAVLLGAELNAEISRRRGLLPPASPTAPAPAAPPA